MKSYSLDTNVFRHRFENSNFHLQQGSRRVLDKIISELTSNEAQIYVPKEVVNELEIQYQSLKIPTKYNTKINALIKSFEISDVIPPYELELHLRRMSAYFKMIARKNGFDFPCEYLKASDARIMFSSLLNESILVTANIKDFRMYPYLITITSTLAPVLILSRVRTISSLDGLKALNKPNIFPNQIFKGKNKALYDIKTSKSVYEDVLLAHILNQDTEFQNMKTQLKQMTDDYLDTLSS